MAVGKTSETKIIFKAKDDVTKVQQTIERGFTKIFDVLLKTGQLPFMDLEHWNRLRRNIAETTHEAERFAAISGGAGVAPRMGNRPRGAPQGFETGRFDDRRRQVGGAPSRMTGMAGGGLSTSGGPVPVIVMNWPQGFGGPGGPGATGGGAGGGGGRRTTLPKKPQPQRGGISWKSIFEGVGQYGPQAMEMATGGVGGAMGGLKMLTGMAGVAGGIGAAVAALGAIVAAGAMISNRLAEPAFAYQRQAYPMAYRMGKETVRGARATGVQYGYTPEESMQLLGGLERAGAQAGFGAVAKLRWSGIEAAEGAQLMGMATQAGAVQPGATSDYERFAKIIAIAISDKTKLPSVPQYLEHLNSLMALSTQYQSDIGITGAETLAAVAKWGETSGTGLLRGTRGAQTFAGIAQWVGRSEDPAQQMLIYQALRDNPRFQQESTQALKDQGMTFGPGQDYWKFMMQREQPEAWMPVLEKYSKIQNPYYGAAMLKKAMPQLSHQQAFGLLKTVREKGGDYEDIKASFKEQGVDLEQMLKGMDEGDLRRKLAETADKQLQIAQQLAPDVAELRLKVMELAEAITPALMVLTEAATIIVKVVPEFGKIVMEGPGNYLMGKVRGLFDSTEKGE